MIGSVRIIHVNDMMFSCTLRFEFNLFLQPTGYPLNVVSHQNQVDQRFGQERWNQVELIMRQVNGLQISRRKLETKNYLLYGSEEVAVHKFLKDFGWQVDNCLTCGWTMPSGRSGSHPACCVWEKLRSDSRSDWKQSLIFLQSGCSRDTAPKRQKKSDLDPDVSLRQPR